MKIYCAEHEDLHSTVVLLKVLLQVHSLLQLPDLHSTVVLLKVPERHRDGAWHMQFTFYCSSIKGS